MNGIQGPCCHSMLMLCTAGGIRASHFTLANFIWPAVRLFLIEPAKIVQKSHYT